MCSEQARCDRDKVEGSPLPESPTSSGPPAAPPSSLRRRFASLVGLVGLLVVGGVIFEQVPRPVELAFELGDQASDLREIDVRYLHEGDEVAGFRRHADAGFARFLQHEVELSPGRYEVWAALRGGRAGEEIDRQVQRAFRVPADGVVTIDLRP